MNRGFAAACAALCVAAIAGAPALAAKAPDTWDGLVRVKSKVADAAYILPGAEFQSYTKVMLAPTEVAFQKNWQRDFNRTSVGLQSRITDEEAEKILTRARSGFEEIWPRPRRSGTSPVSTSTG